MGRKLKKVVAVIVVIILIATAYYVWLRVRGYETGVATLDDVLASSSERKVGNTLTIVSDDSPFYALIGTPVALYYDGTEQKASPLLVEDPDEHNRGVIRFLNHYGDFSGAVIGEFEVENNRLVLSSNEREWESTTSVINVIHHYKDSAEDVSLKVAEHFWKRSDGVILIKSSQEGYEEAVVAMPLASYVNIPVIVTDEVDEKVANVLENLGVKYSLVCGDMKGYKLTKHFDNVEEIQDWTIDIVRQRLNSDVSYITMANPLDAYPSEVETSNVVFSKILDVEHADVLLPWPGMPPTDLEGLPPYFFDVPYMFANVKIDAKLDVSVERYGSDSGARVIVFVGVDENGDGHLDEEEGEVRFFCSSAGYKTTELADQPYGYLKSYDRQPSEDKTPTSKYSHLVTEMPVFNNIGEYCMQFMVILPTAGTLFDPVGKSKLIVEVTVEKLESYVYPRIQDASSLAGYLTAFRKGVVCAKPEFMVWNEQFVKMKDTGIPCQTGAMVLNKNGTLSPVNERVGEVKKELNNLLGSIAGMPTETDEDIIALSEYYHSLNQNRNFTYLGILADTDMIPPFYYYNTMLGYDTMSGYGVPSDLIYADIDADLENEPYGLNERHPRLELAEGRIIGFDVQSISALLSRTFFYNDIIDNIESHSPVVADNEIYNPNAHAARLPSFTLGDTWKNNALGMSADGGVLFIKDIPFPDPAHPPGTEPAQFKVSNAWRLAGMDADHDYKDNQQCGRQEAAMAYESSNLISILVHGWWYWYVPVPNDRVYAFIDEPQRRYDLDPVRHIEDRDTEIGAGSAFDVRNVRLMNFGPSVLWATSCTAGKIDGVPAYNALANSWLHAGMNTYVAASRSMWGSLFFTPDVYSGETMGNYIMLHFYGHITGWRYDKSEEPIPPHYTEVEVSDTSVGVAFMLARNTYITNFPSDGGNYHDGTYQAPFVHGDPAFNP
ncbi:MAG: hypothetical protein L6265_07145, partial [Thermoplasmatales archaeon]|nr:hypothetical protein [Thermoplasmatales archaeon]